MAGPSSSPVMRKPIEPLADPSSRNKGAGGGGEGGNPTLHVGGAAPPNRTLRHLPRERIEPPLCRIADGHHVGMAGKDEERRACAEAGVEIIDVRRAGLRKRKPLRRETRLFQCRFEDAERAAIFRRDRAASDKRAAKVESGGCHGHLGRFRAARSAPFIA